ncbi:PepSY domain-containing protein, partial [Micromonospora azadirachtae]
MRTWLDDLHPHLHVGSVGRHCSEVAASWSWGVALGGLALWWRRNRSSRGRLRRLLLPDLARARVSAVPVLACQHGSLAGGRPALPVRAGLTWSRHARAEPRRRTPELAPALDGASGP